MAVTLCLALGACSDNDAPEGPAATLGAAQSSSTNSAPATSSTTEAESDPYAIPEVIDEAYVERVMNALYGILGDATRLSMEVNGTPPEVLDRIIAVYTNEVDDQFLRAATNRLVEGFEGVKRPPGNSEVTVDEVISFTESCVYAVIRQDSSAALVVPNPEVPLALELRELDPTRDSQNYNPTPWAIDAVSSAPTGSEPDRCAG